MIDGLFDGRNMPFIIDTDSQDGHTKLSHDQYEVFVNDDFVGHKTLIGQTEKMDDVSSYLHRCDFNGFEANLEGDHYNISVEDEDLAEQIKGQLEVYLKVR